MDVPENQLCMDDYMTETGGYSLDQPKEENDLFYNDYFKKSNFLISAKYKSTLLENKLLMLGLVNIKKTEDGNLVSEMKASYLREIMQKGKKNGSFYDQLYETSLHMASRMFVIQDENGFDIFHLTPRAKYVKGTGLFTIYWEKELEKYLYHVQKNFTSLSVHIFMSFESVFTFRLYEIIRSKMYVPEYASKNKRVEDVNYSIPMGLAELKLDMGAVDSSEAKVQQILIPKKKNGGNPDYEKAVSVAKSKTYERWQQFKEQCLEKAIREINEKTDIHVTYDTIKSGRGGKVTEIVFYASMKDKNEVFVEPQKLTEVDKADILDQIADIIDEPLKIKDFAKIAEASDYNIDKVKKAYEVLKASPTDVGNVVGFMITAIRDNYEKPVAKKRSLKARRTDFSNFNQRGEKMTEERRKKYASYFEREMLGCSMTEEEEREYEELKKEYNVV